MTDDGWLHDPERNERLRGVWHDLVEENGGDLERAMRELREITDPMADTTDRETFRDGLLLLNIAGKELDKVRWPLPEPNSGEPEMASLGPGGSSIDWDAPDIARPNAEGVTVLPAEWYCPEDEGLYDDLVR